MTHDIWNELAASDGVAFLAGANTPDMMEQLLDLDPTMQAIVQRVADSEQLQEEVETKAARAATSAPELPRRNAQEMVIIAALYVLVRVAPERALALDSVVASQPRALLAWAQKFASYVVRGLPQNERVIPGAVG